MHVSINLNPLAFLMLGFCLVWGVPLIVYYTHSAYLRWRVTYYNIKVEWFAKNQPMLLLDPQDSPYTYEGYSSGVSRGRTRWVPKDIVYHEEERQELF